MLSKLNKVSIIIFININNNNNNIIIIIIIIIIILSCVLHAQAHGVSEDELNRMVEQGVINWGEPVAKVSRDASCNKALSMVLQANLHPHRF